MSTVIAPSKRSGADLRAIADRHLWRHNSPPRDNPDNPMSVIVEGDGCWVTDADGNRFLDANAGLVCVALGYSFGAELGQAALEQMSRIGYWASWESPNERVIELAEVVAELAPENMNRVFFTPSGGESVEAAWKLARQYFHVRGERRWKAISRHGAYHGTTMGALTITGLPETRAPFEPLVSSASHISDMNRLRRPADETAEQFTALRLAELEHRILSEDPDTVAMVIFEPVQAHGGCLVATPGYYEGVRELCDRYGVLLVADETITAFGRVGEWFASTRYGFKPDIITTAKGLSSSHAVIGAVIVNDRISEEFERHNSAFNHGNTFGGHPTMAAIALKNIEILKRERIVEHVRASEGDLEARLQKLRSIPIVGDVRGAGFFWAIELVSDQTTKALFTEQQAETLFGKDRRNNRLNRRFHELGLLCRFMYEGGEAIISVSPPLVAAAEEFDFIEDVLTTALGELADEVTAA